MARCHKVASLPCPPPQPTHAGWGGGYILYVYEVAVLKRHTTSNVQADTAV